MVAQAKTIALHLGADARSDGGGAQASSAATLAPGDVVIMNDPYPGGMHLPDIFMFMPIFAADELPALSVVICHHTDMGGRVPGSNASDSHRDLPGRPAHPADEALRPRRHERDARSTLIEINVRRARPRARATSTRSTRPARSASARLGRLFAALRRRRDRAAISTELLDYAERMTRAEIATLAARAPTASPTISTATASDDAGADHGRASRCTATAR